MTTDFSKVSVEEYTTPNPRSVTEDTGLDKIFDIMFKQNIRHLLVLNKDEKVTGLISERDVLTFSQSPDFSKIRAKDVMATNPLTFSPNTKLYKVALEMSEHKYGSAIVYDEVTNDYGIFTATDALNALVESLRGDEIDS